MPLKKAKGNMYDWVTHMHSHLGGECPHECEYCYVQKNRFGVSPKYEGAPRLIKSELDVRYGTGKIIFIEHMSDLFAEGIDGLWVEKILNHCDEYPDNTYIFQTKNPWRAMEFHEIDLFPQKYMIGTTIETNRNLSPYTVKYAPSPFLRFRGIRAFNKINVKTFITVEPIMDFDVKSLSGWLIEANPDFVNIGADSKNCNLPEPSKEKILELVKILNENKITIKKKVNLSRIIGG